MKTIKQKLLHSKLSVIAVLFFALILLVTGGFATRKASAETQATFSESQFVMCDGAEVRTDGAKSGIRFVAKLGDAVPTETNYPNLKYNVMIVPKAYITYYEVTGDWYTALKAEMDADENLTNKTIITMQTTPFYSTEVVEGEEGWYIRGTLSNVKYDNINVEWFGMAYITYDGTETDEATGEPKTEYLYAQIPETDANVRSLVYCASGYLNIYDYDETVEEQKNAKDTLTNFVAQGVNKASGVAEADKNNQTKLNAYVNSLANVTETTNLLPKKTANWTAIMPEGVNLHVAYGAEDNAYATYENGVITGVQGDNNAATTKDVTMKILGTSYTHPVHVYVTEVSCTGATEIFSWAGTIGGTEFANSVTLTPTAKIDGEDAELVYWQIHDDDKDYATVENGVVTATNQSKYFATKEVNVRVRIRVGGENGPVVNGEYITVPVSFPIAYKDAPIAYGDLLQNKLTTTDNVASEAVETAQAINTDALTATGWTGNVSQFLVASDMQTDIFDVNTNTTNVNTAYAKNEAGEGKQFVVVSSEGYGYMVEAAVVTYKIMDGAQLNVFFDSYKDDRDGNVTTTGTYVTLGANIEGAKYHKGVQGTNSTYFDGVFDGRGYAIKMADGEACLRGFFADIIGGNAVIKNTAFMINKSNHAGGGLARNLKGNVVIDNCYIELATLATSNAQGGIASTGVATATVTNTIVNIKSTASTSSDNKGTFLATKGTGVDFDTCFSITSDSTNFKYAVGDTKTTINVASDANGLKTAIGATLPESYNSYWTLTDSGLSFGTTQVLTFTTQG